MRAREALRVQQRIDRGRRIGCEERMRAGQTHMHLLEHKLAVVLSASDEKDVAE